MIKREMVFAVEGNHRMAQRKPFIGRQAATRVSFDYRFGDTVTGGMSTLPDQGG